MNSIPNLPYMHETVYEGQNKQIQDVCHFVNSLVDRANRKRDNSNSLDAYENLVKTVSQLAQNSFRDEDVFCLTLLQSNLDVLGRYFKIILSNLPLGGITKVSSECHENIFSFVSAHTLCQLSSVSKAFQKIANNNDLWEKICQQEDSEACKNKTDKNQSWKDFYKNKLFLAFLFKEKRIVFFINRNYGTNGGPKTYTMEVDYTHPKATIRHLKLALHKQEPKLSPAKMNFIFQGGPLSFISPKDNELLKDFELAKCRWYIEYKN